MHTHSLQNDGYGSLVITFQIFVPNSTSEKQKKLLNEVNVHFFKKTKKFFFLKKNELNEVNVHFFHIA